MYKKQTTVRKDLIRKDFTTYKGFYKRISTDNYLKIYVRNQNLRTIKM